MISLMNLIVDMTIEGLCYIEVMILISDANCAGICVRIVLFLSICLILVRVSACFAYEKTVINQRRVEKSAFEDQSEENSV